MEACLCLSSQAALFYIGLKLTLNRLNSDKWMLLIIYKHFVAFDKPSFLRKMQAKCINQHWYKIQKFIDPEQTQFKAAFHIHELKHSTNWFSKQCEACRNLSSLRIIINDLDSLKAKHNALFLFCFLFAFLWR